MRKELRQIYIGVHSCQTVEFSSETRFEKNSNRGRGSRGSTGNANANAQLLWEQQVIISHWPLCQRSLIFFSDWKKNPIKIALTTFPSISGFVQLMQWFRQCAPEAFAGAPSRTLTSHLLGEVSTFKIQQRNKPQTVKEDAAWVYFHPPVLLHISSKAWMSSIFTRWKYYHQDKNGSHHGAPPLLKNKTQYVETHQTPN